MFISALAHSPHPVFSSSAQPSGKLVQEDGRTMKVTSHAAHANGVKIAKIVGIIIGTLVVAAVIVLISVVAGGTGYAVGIPVWCVGAAQTNATMILVGKVFTFCGVGVSGIVAFTLVIVVPVAAIVIKKRSTEEAFINSIIKNELKKEHL